MSELVKEDGLRPSVKYHAWVRIPFDALLPDLAQLVERSTVVVNIFQTIEWSLVRFR